MKWISDRLQKSARNRADPTARFPDLWDTRTAAQERGWDYLEILPPSIQVSLGARAISDDFLRWVDNGPDLLRLHRDAHRGTAFGRSWAAQLHSVHRYKVDKVFRCAIPNAIVVSDAGVVLTDRGELAREAFFNVECHPIRKSELPRESERSKPGRFISLLTSCGDRNLGHFFFDAMLRVALFDSLSDYQFLVPSVLHPWHEGLIDAAGIKPHQLVRQQNPSVKVEELVVCHTAHQGYFPRRELFEKLRATVLGNLAPSPSKPPFRRLFIDRSLAKQRRLVNQKELEPILEDRGFELVRWETLTILQQAALALEAEIIAGPHGTSLLNSAYCLPGAKLLEIINPNWWDTATLRHSALMGHEYWYTFGENASKDFGTKMDPRKFERVLDYMLNAPLTDPPLV